LVNARQVNKKKACVNHHLPDGDPRITKGVICFINGGKSICFDVRKWNYSGVIKFFRILKEKGLLFVEQPPEDFGKITMCCENGNSFEHLSALLKVFEPII